MRDEAQPADGPVQPSRSVGIVSDDLTGANGVAAMFAREGVRACVVLGPRPPTVELPEAAVLVVDTATRDAPPEAAASAVRAAVAWLRAAGARFFAKRIDTTLRGNIGAEIAAMLGELHPDTVAVVVPSAPEAGRVAVGGRVYLDGTPSSEVTGTPDEPLPLILAQAEGLRGAVAVPLELVRCGVASLFAALGNAAHAGVRVFVCDAETEDDVRAIARAASMLTVPVLPADPGRFSWLLAHLSACPLPRTAGGIPTHARPNAPAGSSDRQNARLIAVFGSATAVAAEQIAVAERQELVTVTRLSADLAGGDPDRSEQAAAMVRATITVSRTPAVGIRFEGPLGRGAVTAASALAEIVAAVLAREPRIAGLYLSGGQTARAVLDRLGAEAVAVEGEVLPLAAWGKLIGGPHAGLPLVTKGGMVGGPDAIARCLMALWDRAAATD